MGNLNKLTDDALVNLYLQGNNQAFDELLNRHKDRLYSYIYFIVRSRDVADDIFQETFVKPRHDAITLEIGRNRINAGGLD